MDKQNQGVLLVVVGLLVIGGSFKAVGMEKLFYLGAGILLTVWGILWQR